MSTFSVRPASTLRLGAVTRAIVVQVWPLLVIVGLLFAAALAYQASSGDGVPSRMAWILLVKPAVLGLVVAFALHESAHVFVLKRIPTVTHIRLERTALRTSVIPEGTMTAKQSVVVAVAGPLACVAVGAALWFSTLDQGLAWWYFAHILFLLPFFGDGRALWHGLRATQR